MADRTRTALAALAVGLGLAACGSTPSVTASPLAPTVYAAITSNVANPGRTVAVVDGLTARNLTPITTDSLPSGLAVTPDGRDLLVANKGADTLTEVDVRSGKGVRTIGVGLEPDAVAVSPDGSVALVAEFGDGTVTPIALPDLTVGPPITVGRQPVALVFAADGSRAAVANFGSGSVSLLDTGNRTVIATLAGGREPVSVAFDGAGSTLFVADLQTSAVRSYAVASRKAGPTATTPGDPTGLVWVAGLGRLALTSGGSVSLLAPGATAVTNTLALGGTSSTATALALVPGTTTAWVGDGAGRLHEIDLASGQRIATVTVGGSPTTVAVAPSPGS